MAPSSAAIGGLLRQVINYHLDNSSYSNALFFSERYVAQDPKSTEAAYLVSLSHLRLRDFRSAYDLSKPYGYRGIHLGCVWVFAQACLSLERYKDGITALDKSRPSWIQKNLSGKHISQSRSSAPDAASMLCLLAKLYRAHDDKKKAISYFEEALKLNPFMWDAFTALCDMGVTVRVPNIFKHSEHLLHLFDGDLGTSAVDGRDPVTGPSHDHALKRQTGKLLGMDWGSDPFSSAAAGEQVASDNEMLGETSHSDFLSKIQATRLRLNASSNGNALGADGMETPPTTTLSHDTANTRTHQPNEPPQAPPRRARTANTIDSTSEAPPRMNYRLTGRKLLGKEREKEDSLRQGAVDIVYQEVESSAGSTDKQRTSVPPVERKRTVSGHPVPRSTNADDQGTRRSARLNTFRPPAKPSSGVPAIGITTGRELKKARPQISRIVRPGSSGSNVGRVVSGNRKPVEDKGDTDTSEPSRPRENQSQSTSKSADAEAAKADEALRLLLDLLKKFGNGYYHLSQYQCNEALQSLTSLPAAHQGTPWVLALMGKAHFEQAAYQEAEKFFRKMRVQAPSRLEDMEVYSTILWHLKRETDLSFLAHELIDSAWHSPQAWCALGNAWSLARDPEQALKCFKRATQLDPKFAYAFTLQGHEHVSNEEYEKALTAYRLAISADRRHYNAYYGIGRVYEKLGSYDKAYTHFHSASIINPTNAVLICCIGNVLEKQRQIVQALQYFSKATELAPHAAQTRYKKARALLALNQLDAAQRELEILKTLAPDEATVHFLLGKLYKTLNDKGSAVRHFTIALNLDPKASQQIKEAIESLEDDDSFDDSMIA